MILIILKTILLFLFLMAVVDAQAGLKEGELSYKNGNYPTALTEFRKLAANGDMVAQNNLGEMYANGHGVPKNYEQAEIWYRKSAEQGYAKAQYNLGYLYHNGLGLPQDYKQAAFWYQKSSEQRKNDAHINILEAQSKEQTSMKAKPANDKFAGSADSHEVPVENLQAEKTVIEAEVIIAKQEATSVSRINAPSGRKILEDSATAFRSAAEQGDADAQYNLGLMYDNGQGVVQDYDKAVMWYRKSAEQGNMQAQINLARMYLKGHGVEYDYQQAVKWFARAAKQGSFEARQEKETLRRSAGFR